MHLAHLDVPVTDHFQTSNRASTSDSVLARKNSFIGLGFFDPPWEKRIKAAS
jgi:hypothetical protein